MCQCPTGFRLRISLPTVGTPTGLHSCLEEPICIYLLAQALAADAQRMGNDAIWEGAKTTHNAGAPERGALTGQKPKHNAQQTRATRAYHADQIFETRPLPGFLSPTPSHSPFSHLPTNTPPPGNGTRCVPLAQPRYLSPTSLCRRQQPLHPTHVDSSTTALLSTTPGAPAANHAHLQPPTLSDPRGRTNIVRPSGSDPRVGLFFDSSARLPRPVACAKVREVSSRLGLRFDVFQVGGRMVASWAVSAAVMIDRGSRIATWRASSQAAGVVGCVFVAWFWRAGDLSAKSVSRVACSSFILARNGSECLPRVTGRPTSLIFLISFTWPMTSHIVGDWRRGREWVLGEMNEGSAEADLCEEPRYKNAGCVLIAPFRV